MRLARYALAVVVAVVLAAVVLRIVRPGPMIVVVAGMPTYNGDGIPATKAYISRSEALCVDRAGNVHIADTYGNRVRKVDVKTGLISTFAGTGAGGCSSDGVLASQAKIQAPMGLCFDDAGNLFIGGGHRVRRVDAVTGRIRTVVGTGKSEFNGDGIRGLEANVCGPFNIAVDREGSLYLAEETGNRIRKVDGRTGIISTLAGTGKFGEGRDGAKATDSPVDQPTGIAISPQGEVYFTGVCRVWRIDKSGRLRAVAGTGKSGYNGDGIPAKRAQLGYLYSQIRFDRAGNLVIADYGNGRIRLVDAKTGLISTIAGQEQPKLRGLDGFHPPTVMSPTGIDLDEAGNVYWVEETACCVRRLDVRSGCTSTIAGVPLDVGRAEGVPASTACLLHPGALAINKAGDLYFAEWNTVRRVDAAKHLVRTVVGSGEYGFNGDGIPALKAKLESPTGLAVDPDGNLYLAESNGHRVRRVDAKTGLISTVAGGGKRGYNGDGIPARRAELDVPVGVAADASGNLYIADQQGNRVRRVDAETGLISTVAGTGKCKWGEDGIPATSSEVCSPSGIAFNDAGDVFILDSGTCRVRKVDARTGLISTVAGGGKEPPRSLMKATRAKLGFFYGIAVDPDGDIYVSETWEGHRIYKINGKIDLLRVVAGTGESGYNGATVRARKALLHSPWGLALDASGNLYVADSDNHCVRKIVFHR
jgi:DNA-binding beta-propeller fold protein YncE